MNGKKITPVLLLILIISILLPILSANSKVIKAGKYEQLVLIHSAKGGVPGPPSGGGDEPKDNDAFALIGPEWDMPEGCLSYIIDLDGAPTGAESEIYLSFEAWDQVNDLELFDDFYVVDNGAEPNLESVDGNHVVCWRKIIPRDIIAVTYLWWEDTDGDKEPSPGERFVDFDMIMNALHKWGIDPDNEGPLQIKEFDVQNIVTHEAGHVVGLADLYDDVNSELTMYGYGKKGETKKISLENGDELGCQLLYP
jgi:hypothetical protein